MNEWWQPLAGYLAFAYFVCGVVGILCSTEALKKEQAAENKYPRLYYSLWISIASVSGAFVAFTFVALIQAFASGRSLDLIAAMVLISKIGTGILATAVIVCLVFVGTVALLAASSEVQGENPSENSPQGDED